MEHFHRPYLKTLLVIMMLLATGYGSRAQVVANSLSRKARTDSSAKLTMPVPLSVPAQGDKIDQSAAAPTIEETKLLDDLGAEFKKPKERRQLLRYLKQLTAGDDVNYMHSKVKLYYRLANAFARLRLYPLAMKFFFKAMQSRNEINLAAKDPPDSLQRPTPDDADSLKLSPAYFAVNANDDSVLTRQETLSEKAPPKEDESQDITYDRIQNTFNDGKKAVGYAVLFHVKQPAAGKRKIFVFTNTGHTFITLIKYNIDSTYVSLSFGFYPRKDNILSATPIVPSTSSVFKNDSGHEWDEVLGKFITKRRFDKILLLTKKYNGMKYHLSKNNCTDFGINAANLAGIRIEETWGSWPLGSGNNPAVTGQSILQGKLENRDKDGLKGLFIDKNLEEVKEK